MSSLDEVIRMNAEETSYFVKHPDLLFHAAILSRNPAMDLKREMIMPNSNSDDIPEVRYKLYRPHDHKFNKTQKYQTCSISELGPRISSIESMAIQADMVKCPDITEPFIMWNMLMRFLNDEIYTSIGDILICVNPFKNIKGLYDNERIIAVKEQPDLQDLSELPHVYNMANAAINGLTYKNKTQSIIISGESGAGKTEQVRKIADRSLIVNHP
jgi:myosin heavy subunit